MARERKIRVDPLDDDKEDDDSHDDDTLSNYSEFANHK